MEKIDIKKLVSDIKECEAARRKGQWSEYTKEREMGQQFGQWWHPAYYEEHVTALYTLRAWCRGKMHRQNPPAPIRDFNRTMEETRQTSRMTWDMEAHNRRIAEETALKYEFNDEPEAHGEPEVEEKPMGFLQRIFG